jgi:hypothetical protein
MDVMVNTRDAQFLRRSGGGYRMLYSLESLKSDVANRINLWDCRVITSNEMVGFLLDRFAFALMDFPNDLNTVTQTFELVPAFLISGMRERLCRDKTESTRWHWLPAGPGIPTPGPVPQWRIANELESVALDLLENLLAKMDS